MTEIIISIQPKWCNLIATKEKKIDLRKTKPKIQTPFKCRIYCTIDEPLYHSGDKFYHKVSNEFGNGKIIGEFICNKIETIEIRHFTVLGHENVYTAVGDDPDHQWLKKTCLTYEEVVNYGRLATLYGWHISELVIYDTPKTLKEIGLKKAPQSWCYIKKENSK